MSSEKAALLTYNTNREYFDSVYERNKFYRGLFGYKQTVKKNGKTYQYEKEGLMDKVPNARIDDSVFIFARKNTEKVESYFHKWEKKVSHHIFTVLVQEKHILDKIKEEDKYDRQQQ